MVATPRSLRSEVEGGGRRVIEAPPYLSPLALSPSFSFRTIIMLTRIWDVLGGNDGLETRVGRSTNSSRLLNNLSFLDKVSTHNYKRYVLFLFQLSN